MRLEERDHRLLVLWATECAEHVLAYFEENNPKDNRLRHAIEAGRAWVRGEIAVSEARAAAFAAHASAREADQGAAHAAATAHVAAHAAHAASYAAVPTDPGAAAEERDWHNQRLPKHLRPVAFPESPRLRD